MDSAFASDFLSLAKAIHVACTEPVSIDDYFAVVQRLRELRDRADRDDAVVRAVAEHMRWPSNYDAFESDANLRFGCVFDTQDNPRIAEILGGGRSPPHPPLDCCSDVVQR